MPKNKYDKRSELDKFYTRPEVARRCLDKLSEFLEPGSFVVEPSAGSGAFFHQITNPKLGIDIAPEHYAIKQMDFFDLCMERPGVAVVGNPPFGERGRLIDKFIKHASSFADTVAFILPRTYKKLSKQKVFPDSWKLVAELDLGDGEQFTVDGEPVHIPTVFQVWTNKDFGVDLRESRKPEPTTTDFMFTEAGGADWFMFGAAPGNIVHPSNVTENNRGYYLKCSEEVKRNLQSINWKKHALSTVAGGAAWFTKREIIAAYNKEKK